MPEQQKWSAACLSASASLPLDARQVPARQCHKLESEPCVWAATDTPCAACSVVGEGGQGASGRAAAGGAPGALPRIRRRHACAERRVPSPRRPPAPGLGRQGGRPGLRRLPLSRVRLLWDMLGDLLPPTEEVLQAFGSTTLTVGPSCTRAGSPRRRARTASSAPTTGASLVCNGVTGSCCSPQQQSQPAYLCCWCLHAQEPAAAATRTHACVHTHARTHARTHAPTTHSALLWQVGLRSGRRPARRPGSRGQRLAPQADAGRVPRARKGVCLPCACVGDDCSSWVRCAWQSACVLLVRVCRRMSLTQSWLESQLVCWCAGAAVGRCLPTPTACTLHCSPGSSPPALACRGASSGCSMAPSTCRRMSGRPSPFAPSWRTPPGALCTGRSPLTAPTGACSRM